MILKSIIHNLGANSKRFKILTKTKMILKHLNTEITYVHVGVSVIVHRVNQLNSCWSLAYQK